MIPILQKCEKLSIGRLDVVVCDDDVKVAFACAIPEYHLDQNELLVCNAADDDLNDNDDDGDGGDDDKTNLAGVGHDVDGG